MKPSPKVIPPGASPPLGNESTTALAAGSMRTTESVAKLAAHTALAPNARQHTGLPAWIVATTVLLAGSIRRIVPAGPLATQMDPKPASTLTGVEGSGIVATICPPGGRVVSAWAGAAASPATRHVMPHTTKRRAAGVLARPC